MSHTKRNATGELVSSHKRLCMEIITKKRAETRIKAAVKTFRYWHRLPPELQLAIWDAAIDDLETTRIINPLLQNNHSWAKPPPLFYACLDSHLRLCRRWKWKMMLGRQPASVFPRDSRLRKVWAPYADAQLVNPSGDIIFFDTVSRFTCFGTAAAANRFREEDRKAVRFLAVPKDQFVCLHFSLLWPNIEVLYLVDQTGNEYCDNTCVATDLRMYRKPRHELTEDDRELMSSWAAYFPKKRKSLAWLRIEMVVAYSTGRATQVGWERVMHG